MARVKRFFSACWNKDRHGKWYRMHVGQPTLWRPPVEASPLKWAHRDDKLEAIIADKLGEDEEQLFLAKWINRPIEQASWENRHRFTVQEKQAYMKQKADLQYIEAELDDESVKVLCLHHKSSLVEFDEKMKELVGLDTLEQGPRRVKKGKQVARLPLKHSHTVPTGSERSPRPLRCVQPKVLLEPQEDDAMGPFSLPSDA